jgi:hypothetical protein
MCQKDLASYRLRLLLSRPNDDEIVNIFHHCSHVLV